MIYLDNAATTPLDPEVLKAMLPYMETNYGNPSAGYAFGRQIKSAIEAARRDVAQLLGAKPLTLHFTSGGTESNNTAIAAAVGSLNCTHIITSPIEHHAVLHTIEYYSRRRGVSYSIVKLTRSGEVDYIDLESQLAHHVAEGKKCFVSLMHANNETGALLDLVLAGDICRRYQAVFHADCVQTIGHYPINLQESGVHFASAAGHKFHGPKGIGLLYINSAIKAEPLIYGGSQERGMRAGTENVYGIIGFAKALELAMSGYEKDCSYITELNMLMRNQLKKAIPEVSFNNPKKSLYTVLSVCFPGVNKANTVTEFDRLGICVSGGSACSSDEDGGSHVMKALGKDQSCNTVRFSFSKHNTKAEILRAVEVAQHLLLVSNY